MLIVFPLWIMLYIHRLARLTQPNDEFLRETLKNSCAGTILNILQSPSHAKTMGRLTPQERRLFGRDFVAGILPQLFREARQVTLAARHPLILWQFGLFCLAYVFVWVKVRMWAEVEDLRYLVGAQASLLRTAGAAG